MAVVIFPSFSIKVSSSVYFSIEPRKRTGLDLGDLLPWLHKHLSVPHRLPECSEDLMLGVEVTHELPVNFAKYDYHAPVSGLCQRHIRFYIGQRLIELTHRNGSGK